MLASFRIVLATFCAIGLCRCVRDGSIGNGLHGDRMKQERTEQPSVSFEATNWPPMRSRFLSAGIFVVWLAIIWLWPVSVYTLTVDDSYYYLKTADNAAHGYGFTFDQINDTNGFHPLWMAMLLPIAWICGGNMVLLARLAITTQLVMVYAGAELLSRSVGDRKRWIVLSTSILMINFYYAKILLSALESGLQWFCLCATSAATLSILKLGN